MFILPASMGLVGPEGSSPPAAPAFVQVANDTRDNTSLTLDATWGTATTTGNLLIGIMSVMTPGAGTVPSAFTPPAGAGWTSAIGQTVDLGNGGGRQRIEIFYIENAASQSGATGAWTYTGGVYMGGSTNACLTLLEYSGIAASGALDKTASYASPTNGGGYPYTDDTTVYSGTPATTSQAVELAIAGLANGQWVHGSPSGGFTNRASIVSNGLYMSAEELVLSATGTPNTSATYASAFANCGVIATFKGA